MYEKRDPIDGVVGGTVARTGVEWTVPCVTVDTALCGR